MIQNKKFSFFLKISAIMKSDLNFLSKHLLFRVESVAFLPLPKQRKAKYFVILIDLTFPIVITVVK